MAHKEVEQVEKEVTLHLGRLFLPQAVVEVMTTVERKTVEAEEVAAAQVHLVVQVMKVVIRLLKVTLVLLVAQTKAGLVEVQLGQVPLHHHLLEVWHL